MTRAEFVGLTEQQMTDAQRVLDRVVPSRFRSVDKAEAWIVEGRIPGHGDSTPLEMIKEGRADWVIHAIDAIDAGVHA